MSLWEILNDADERRARINRVNGVACGVITDNHDPEGRARVKVTFPWLGEGIESDWTRFVTFMAGRERGGYFLPEVGDEVLVAFEHGDINHPYVLGALWSSEDPPPEANRDGNNNIRKIKSRSGHELIFCDDDQARKEKIEIRTRSGHRIILDDSQGSEKVVIEDKTGSNVIRMDSVKGEISLESRTSVKIRSQMIQIEGGATVEIKGALVKIN